MMKRTASRWRFLALTALALTLSGAVPPGEGGGDVPACRDAGLEFRGNYYISGREIRTAILKRYFDRKVSVTLINRIGKDLEKLYRRQGYYRAEVFRTESNSNFSRVVFHIREGPQGIVRNIVISGNPSIPADELRDAMDLWQREPLSRRLYNTELLDGGRQGVLAYCQGQGFLDAEVALVPDIPSDGRDITLRVTVKEGRRYVIDSGAIVFEGMTAFPREAIMARLDLGGDPFFRPANVMRCEARLRDVYAEEGYAFVSVASSDNREEARASGRVRLVFRVKEGEKAVIRRVRVEGNRTTKDSFIRRFIAVKEGMPYRHSEANRTLQQLSGTGLFSAVRVEPVPVPEGAPSDADLLIKLEERRLGAFDIGGGYGSRERIRGVADLSYNNFLGIGWQIGGLARVSSVGYRVEGRLIDPAFTRGEITEELRGYREERQEISFSTISTGATVQVSKAFRERAAGENSREAKTPGGPGSDGVQNINGRSAWASPWPDREIFLGSLRLRYERSEAFDLDLGAEVDINDIQLRGLEGALVWDLRDNYFNPSRGLYHRLAFEVVGGPLGAKADFLKWTGQIAGFLPFVASVPARPGRPGREGVTLGAGWRFGTILPYGDATQAPIQERYFLGGASSVRGFKEDSISPRDAFGNYIGGNHQQVFNAELRFPLVRDPFAGVIFFDAGDVWSRASDFRLQDVRTSAGGGVRIGTPIGPVRVDVGRKLRPGMDSDQNKWAIHLSIGHVF
ncbi:MAG: BamA/TamA family outer membrane protein [Planctomycetota bacterium]